MKRKKLVTLSAGNHIIRPSSQESLLGCTISDDLKWRNHLIGGNQSVVRQIVGRINGLSKLSTRADFKTRLVVANGVVMSKIVYLIQLWGGCESYLIRALQIQQNRAARIVTRSSRYTSIRKLLTNCGWLSIKQMVIYHTLLIVHKTILVGQPHYLNSRVDTHHSYATRQDTSGCIRIDSSFSCKSDLTVQGFRYRAANDYNRLPPAIRQCKTISQFKSQLKKWILEFVDVE